MKVFISWSGTLSRDVAELLHRLLPCIIQGIEVFLSQHNIESGARWSLQLAKELEESAFGIMCLTADNYEAPWILFEAGAFTKHIEGRACGLLLAGLKATDITGPLSQFQHREMLREEFVLLIRDINKNLDKPLPISQLEMIIDKWWPDIESGIEAAKKGQTNKVATVQRGERDMLEELVRRMRALESPSQKNRVASRAELAEHPYIRDLLKGWVGRLSEDEHLILQEIGRLKREGNHVGVGEFIEDVSPNHMNRLLDLGLVYKDEKRGLLMSTLLAYYLVQNRNRQESQKAI